MLFVLVFVLFCLDKSFLSLRIGVFVGMVHLGQTPIDFFYLVS